MNIRITKKDTFLLLALFIMLIIIGYTGFYLFGEIMLEPLIITILIIILLSLIEIYRRLTEVILGLKEQQIKLHVQQENNYQQLESSFSLFFTIKPELPLPKMRGWAASPDFLKKIVDEVLTRKPNLIVEASSGVTTLMIAYSLQKNGHGKVISLESEKKYLLKTKKMIHNHNLEDYSIPFYAQLKNIIIDEKSFMWYDTDLLKLETPIDILIVDGPIGSQQSLSRYPALPIFYNNLSKNAIVLMDDGKRSDEKKIIKLWENKYPDITSEYLSFEEGAFILRRNGQEN